MKIFILLQYCVPHHLLSRLIGFLAETKCQWVKKTFIRWFIRRYQVDMSIAERENPEDYVSFNDFFTRKLKATVRPMPNGTNSILNPADGVISQIGKIEKNKIFQAKGHDFTTEALLGSQEWGHFFVRGDFATVYLSPKDYHRVHMPFSGKLIAMRYIPGCLFSVNAVTAESIPGLFARNERAVFLFETVLGKMAVVMVGAMIVAGIQTVWSGKIKSAKKMETFFYEDEKKFSEGDELGAFYLGSTAIVLFERNKINWLEGLESGSAVIVKSALATLKNKQRID